MDKVFSVSEFIGEVNALLSFPVVVEGEVSSYRVNQGKWVFFDLKDEKEEALVNCFAVVWKLKTPIEDGMRVRISGTPKIFEKSGKFSITVERVEPVGEGALKRAFELLRKKLSEEGLFAPERKRPLPRFPELIGLVASRESAAYGDFLRILNNRWRGVTVNLLHVTVQGDAAVSDVSGAIKYFSAPEAPKVDVLVVIRGGGSLEDLAAFNSEEVARAIYASRIPTIVGVGHERDETIADYVADVRASTPSNAAELVAPDRREVLSDIEYFTRRSRSAFDSLLASCQHRIGTSVEAIIRTLLRQSDRYRRLVLSVSGAFRQLAERLLHYKRSVDLLSRTVASLNPERLLSRGYSIVRSRGKIVKDASSLNVGDSLEVRLHKGTIEAKVQSVNS